MDDRAQRLDVRRYRLERATIVLTLVALGVAAVQSWIAADSVDAAREQVTAARIQADAAMNQTRIADEQLTEARYQSVYERLLEVDRLLASEPESAPLYVIDFYNYVFENVPGILGLPYPQPLALRSPSDAPDVGPLEAWRTWSETIASGFRNFPVYCTSLDEERRAFSDSFIRAIRDAGLCPGLRLPTEP